MSDRQRATGKKKIKAGLCDQMGFQTAEAFKMLRSNIRFCLAEYSGCRVIGVSSSRASEGKTVSAINLSYAIAEAGNKVLLIEADMRMPSVATKLGVLSTGGLSNLLAKMISEEETIYQSDYYENWHIMTAGDIPPNPSELLGSDVMKGLIEELRTKYDYIILDLPPVNIVTDASEISPLLDGIIIVVRQNNTRKKELKTCMNQVSRWPTKFLGYIMNQASD